MGGYSAGNGREESYRGVSPERSVEGTEGGVQIGGRGRVVNGLIGGRTLGCRFMSPHR